MTVLGLDLSTKTGYAVISDSEALVAHGYIEHATDDIFPLEEYRYMHIAKLISVDINKAVLKHNPESIIIEQTNLGSSRESQKFLEFIHYAVLQGLLSAGYGDKITYVDSSAWRTGLGIKLSKEQRIHNRQLAQAKLAAKKSGIAKSSSKKGQGKITWKHLSVNFVNQKFNLNLLLVQDDIADAICLGLFGLKDHLRFKKATPVEFDISVFNK